MNNWHDWPTVIVHPSQHPEQLSIQLVAALRAHRIPAKFHYLTPQQARRWLAVHVLHAPSGGAVAATTTAYRGVFEALARDVAGRAVQILSLGCGGGAKDALLARALLQAGCTVRYLAVDAGQALVLGAAAGVSAVAPQSKVRRLVADLDRLDDLRGFAAADGADDEIQLVCAFGILPNAVPDALLGWLAANMLTADKLLLSTNLYDPDDPRYDLKAISPQYDNLATRRWLSTFFGDLDWAVQPEDFKFEIHEERVPAQIQAVLELAQPIGLDIEQTRIEFDRGTRLQVFFTNRFCVPVLSKLLEKHGFHQITHTETALAAEALWQAERL